MLKGIDPLLNADVLHALRSMGHGDDLVIVDTNFPASSVAKLTSWGKLLRIDAPAARVAEAVLSVYPLDTFVDDTVARMEVVGNPERLEPVQVEVKEKIDAVGDFTLNSIERYAFYERARNAFAILQTGERRFYGCFALRMGVVAPDV